MIVNLFLILFALFILTVPIGVSLGFASIIVLKMDGASLSTIPQQLFQGLDSFTLMAAPFFILAGSLMQHGGISRRLINLSNAILGWIKGGLGGVVVLTSMLFATLSGSSSATAAAVGSTLIPAMEKKGYPKEFAAATTAASGELGSIIPPSISLIMFGLVANVSISQLFLAGVVPGLFIGITLIITVIIIAKIKDYDEVVDITFIEWAKNVGKAFSDSLFALLMPVIILGGIYLGLFTPTESAVIAVVYGFIVGWLVYKELNLKKTITILVDSSIIISILLFIIGFANVFSYILTSNRVPHLLATYIESISTSPLVFLLLVNVLLLIVGMFMETLTSIVILGPILVPVALQYGIDPVHFGIVMTVNLAIGMVTPPIGVNLFVVSEIANLPIEKILKPVSIFLLILIVDLMIITYFPKMSLIFA